MPSSCGMRLVIKGGVSGRYSNWAESPALLAEYLSRGAWHRADHLDYISDRIKQIEERPLRLIVIMPPRHGKSELISHWTPVWFLKRWPHKKIILTSYQAGFATQWGGATKNSMIENASLLDLELTTDTKAKAHWMIKGYGGEMIASGIGGPLTGRGGDLVIIDDPIKSQKEAMSEVYRNSTWEWYRATLRTRLQPGGSIIILMTRWHEDDLVGRLLGEMGEELPYQDKWEIINLPALAQANDLLGRKEGQALWPQMFDINDLLTTKGALGSFWWDAEYMGVPRAEGGGIIKEAWFQYYSEDEDPLQNEKIKILRIIQIWDTAYKDTQLNDRSACSTFIETKDGYLLADVWFGRPLFPELCKIVKAKYYQYLPNRVLVEDKASGTSLVQQIRADTKIPIHALKSTDDKSTRLHAVSGVVEAEKVRLPVRAPWIPEFLHEVCGFPTSQFDDITDTFSYGLLQLSASLMGQRGILRRGKKRLKDF